MQWEQLIDELVAAVDAEDRRELVGEVADRTRRELARLHLVDRLRAAVGATVTIGLGSAGVLTGQVLRVGPDWLLLGHEASEAGAELLVAASAIVWIGGLPPDAVDPAAVSTVDKRLGLGSVLRAVARDRRIVHVSLREGGEVGGVVRRVGGDFVDVGAAPRAGQHNSENGGSERCLPFAAVAVIRLR